MDQFQLQFVEHEEEARNISNEMFIKMYQTEQKKQRESTMQFLNKINQNLNSHDSSPRSKYMTILILRDVLESCIKPETKFNKLFSTFLNHKLLETIADFCESIDPNKAVQDKGRKYFPGQGQLGHNFIRCNLELLKMLASKFPKGKNQDATTFKKKYNKLVQQKVTFPNQYTFISLPGGSKGSKEEGQPYEPRTSNRNPGARQYKAQPQKQRKSITNSKQKDLVYLQGKVKAILEALADGDDEQYIQAQIVKLHELVLIDDQKFQNIVVQIFQKNQGEEIANRYLNANQFINVEKQSFQKNINQRRNLPVYAQDLRQAAKMYFPNSISSTPGGGQIKMTESKQYDVTSKIKSNEQKPRESNFILGAFNGIAQYFQEVQKKSKSPIGGGFRKINESLSRQKSKNAPLKSKHSPHTHTKSNMSKSINSLKGSKIAAIFANPPNPNPPFRSYQGSQIEQNYSVEDLIRHIDKNQGHRRFATSNFKGKGSIFQNQHIQIGFKSQAVYEQVSGFRVLLKIQLFFGNLGQQTFRNLTLHFKGDQTILLYANPRQIQQSARQGEQNKIDLVIIPLKPQFPLLTMKIRYQVSGRQFQNTIILPNSVLKFINFMEVIKSEFLLQWQSTSLFKTTEFSLSHHLPPDTLIRWIPSLSQLSPYNQFVVPGSRNDYQLYTSLILMQRYQALLKVTVRPNLRVVLQLGLDQRNQEAVGYFMTFLQHLQQIMKQTK